MIIDGHTVLGAQRRCWRREDPIKLRSVVVIGRAQVQLAAAGGLEHRDALLVASTDQRDLGTRFVLLFSADGGLHLMPWEPAS